MRELKAHGGRISCCKGCGACWIQLVPISEAEARRIAKLVESLPEPRRSQVKARFEDAAKRLAEAGLLKASAAGTLVSRRLPRVRLGIFRQAIPCPFLEDEACSIYPDRPITCREFLVTTPAIYCRPCPRAYPAREVADECRSCPGEDWSSGRRILRATLGAPGARAGMERSQYRIVAESQRPGFAKGIDSAPRGQTSPTGRTRGDYGIWLNTTASLAEISSRSPPRAAGRGPPPK